MTECTDQTLETITFPEKTELLSESAWCDALAQTYVNTMQRLDELSKLKVQLVDELDKLAGTPEKQSGTVKIVGDELKVVVTRGLDSSYLKKDTDNAPFLQVVFELVPELRPALSVKFSEKLAMMTKLIAQIKSGELVLHGNESQNQELLAIVDEVVERRQIKASRPQIKVSPV